jgi:hypothetical protein
MLPSVVFALMESWKMPNEDLTTLAAAKVSARETGSADDTELGRMLDATEAAVAKWLRKNYQGTANALTSFEATEFFSADGDVELWLPRFPVTAIEAVYVDNNGYFGHKAGAFASDTEWTIGEDYTPGFSFTDLSNRGALMSLRKRSHGLFAAGWPSGTGNVKVTYTAGYEEMTADIVQGVHRLFSEMVLRWRNGNGPDMQSETHSRYSYTLLTERTSRQMAHVRSLLMPYRDRC